MARTSRALAAVLAIAGTIPLGGGLVSAQTTSTDVYKINYFSNNIAAAPDATLRISNPGVTYGNLCAMLYVFDNDQRLAECCGCIQTPNDLRTLSVKRSLTSNPLTGRIPTSGVINIVSALPAGSVCDPSKNVVPRANLRAWLTHIENPVGATYPITETASTDVALGASELSKLQAQCAMIYVLGSGAGICACATPTPPTVCTVTSGPSVSPTSVSLIAGQSQQLTAKVTYSDGSTPVVTWSSSDSSTVTVTPSTGLTVTVKGLKAGQAKITANFSSSTSCHADPITIPVTVTQSTTTTCAAESSLSTLVQGSKVTAYVPNGSWTTFNTGVLVVPIEPAPLAVPSSIATPGVVNSCASNSLTGQTVCTSNSTDVYLISGSTLNRTLTSGGTGGASFSGGHCATCGVIINPITNTALITIGDSSAPSHSGFQFLDLATSSFSTPAIPANYGVSENVAWDPGRNLILSPNEQGTFDLFDSSRTTLPEFSRAVGGELDAGAEDCTTGIGLATDEYTSNLFITDLTQAKFTAGSPTGTWTAPSSVLNIPDFDPYDGPESGTAGIAVDSNSHLGIVTGEYPNPPSLANAIIAFRLPSTSGTGTPAFVDWVVAVLPNDPSSAPFSMGCDPHTVSIYESPNSGKVIGVVSDYSWIPCKVGGSPQYLGLIDLQSLLSAPRTPGTHTVSPTYDLLANGVVKFVAAQ